MLNSSQISIRRIHSRENTNDLNCIVLKGCSFLPYALRYFQIYCAHPNLGITRTSICRLNFAQMSIFSGLRFFDEPEISDSGPPSLKSLPEDLCSGFLRPEKIHRPQPDFNPRTLDLEASSYPETNEADNDSNYNYLK